MPLLASGGVEQDGCFGQSRAIEEEEEEEENGVSVAVEFESGRGKLWLRSSVEVVTECRVEERDHAKQLKQLPQDCAEFPGTQANV